MLDYLKVLENKGLKVYKLFLLKELNKIKAIIYKIYINLLSIMELTSGKIYEEYSKKNLDINSATKLLLSSIESSNRNKVRVESIEKWDI